MFFFFAAGRAPQNKAFRRVSSVQLWTKRRERASEAWGAIILEALASTMSLLAHPLVCHICAVASLSCATMCLVSDTLVARI